VILNAILFCEQVAANVAKTEFKGITTSVTLTSMPLRLGDLASEKATMSPKRLARLYLASVWLGLDNRFSPKLVVRTGNGAAQYFDTPVLNASEEPMVHAVGLDNVVFNEPGLYHFDLTMDREGFQVIASAALDVRLSVVRSLSRVYA